MQLSESQRSSVDLSLFSVNLSVITNKQLCNSTIPNYSNIFALQ